MTDLLIRNLPAADKVRSARLPQIYETAKLAIAECSRIDECKTWADQAEALASYARQAKDEELRKMADRIQARAIRRCGELLKQFDARGNHRKSNGGGTSSQKQMADNAGLSKRQQVTSVRVANVPEEEFEDELASSDPPTVTAFAERGIKPRPKPLVDLGDITPEEFQAATQLIGLLRHFCDESKNIDVRLALRGFKDHEWASLREYSECALEWISKLGMAIKEVKGKCIR